MAVLQRVTAHNFTSFADLTIPLTDLSVLVGPNGAGKSNLLKVFRFLGESARSDLGPAVASFGGFEQLLFRGARKNNRIRIELLARVTKFSSEKAPDEYSLEFYLPMRTTTLAVSFMRRREVFVFKRTKGQGRRITLSGSDVWVQRDGGTRIKALTVQPSSSGLSILRRLGNEVEAPQVGQLADLFETIRVFDVDVGLARQPAAGPFIARLADNAGNLAAYLFYVSAEHPEVFQVILDDMRQVLPGLATIEVRAVGGATEGRVVFIHEQGLTSPIPLALASYGTVRALALFAMLNDPSPPKLTCIEEIDHGLHPYALDRLVDRLRTAAKTTQIVAATHSPALVNRLDPSELVVFERDEKTGATRRPDVSAEEIATSSQDGAYRLGELWFSGVLGGVPNP